MPGRGSPRGWFKEGPAPSASESREAWALWCLEDGPVLQVAACSRGAGVTVASRSLSLLPRAAVEEAYAKSMVKMSKMAGNSTQLG